MSDVSMISDTADVGIALGRERRTGQLYCGRLHRLMGCPALADAPLYAPYQNELQKRRVTRVNGTYWGHGRRKMSVRPPQPGCLS